MKLKIKIAGILLMTVFLTGFSPNTSAQKDRKLTNGFSINLISGIPSAAFGAEDNISSEWKYAMLFGLKLGNRWYFSTTEKYGIGLMINWIDIVVATKSVNGDSRATADVSLFPVGPIGTIIIGENSAVDGYYNLRYTGFATAFGSNSNDIESFSGAGFSHALGAAFRWKALNVGLEYVVGSIKCKYSVNESITSKLKTNSMRLNIGFKF